MIRANKANKTLLALFGTAFLLVTACTDPNQVGGYDPNRKTRQGAIIGGLVGAGTGAAVSDSKGKGALLGGAIGALGGAAIGSALDRQEAELRQQLDSDVRIVNSDRQFHRRIGAARRSLQGGAEPSEISRNHGSGGRPYRQHGIGQL
jgi:outer membrane lipoprotein SlyB